MSDRLLENIRVIEMEGARCAFCGKLLADMGAEVIKIEPEEGDVTRTIPPFFHDEEGTENSLFHAFFNAGKKSMVLNREDDGGRETFLSLIRSADVLLDSALPGDMEEKGLGFVELRKVNPGLVYCSLTPYGNKGPWMRRQADSDMVLYASGGAMYESGEPDKAPLQLGYNFLTNGANLYALTGIMAALNARESSGLGDRVEVSVLEVAAAWRGSEFGFIQQAPLYKTGERKGSQGIMVPSNFYRCKDGYAFIMASGRWPDMIQWMNELGVDIRGKDDPKYLPDQGFNQYLWAELDEVNGMINELTMHYSMKELTEEGQRRGIPIGPAETVRTVLENEQYLARDYFREIESGSIGTARYPAKAFGFAKTPMLTERPAPKLGQDTEEIRRSLEQNKDSGQTGEETVCRKPLEGVLVLDFGWVVAGPHAGRVMCDLGATVIRVESAGRLDPMRIDARRCGLSEKDSLKEGGWAFQDNARNKMDLGINMKTPQGRQIFEELVKKTDIIICNFAPRGFHHMGIDFESLSKIKKDIIIVNASGLGDYGPYSTYRTFAPVLACFTGVTSLMGYEGLGPFGYPGLLPDYMGGVSVAASALAALYHRNRTGEGQFVDLCQAEATLQNLGPMLLDWQLNGRLPEVHGNHDDYGRMAPHNCYECSTENTWMTLAVADDEQWNRFAAEFQEEAPELADGKFRTAEGRRENQKELDEIIGNLCRNYEAEALASRIQGRGVSASKVYSTMDTMYHNEQLEALDYFKRIELEKNGLEPDHFMITGPLIHSEGGDPESYQQGPAFAKDNEYIIKEMLGFDDTYYQECVSSHVFS